MTSEITQAVLTDTTVRLGVQVVRDRRMPSTPVTVLTLHQRQVPGDDEGMGLPYDHVRSTITYREPTADELSEYEAEQAAAVELRQLEARQEEARRALWAMATEGEPQQVGPGTEVLLIYSSAGGTVYGDLQHAVLDGQVVHLSQTGSMDRYATATGPRAVELARAAAWTPEQIEADRRTVHRY